jgi:hypothetical protein
MVIAAPYVDKPTNEKPAYVGEVHDPSIYNSKNELLHRRMLACNARSDDYVHVQIVWAYLEYTLGPKLGPVSK